MTKYLIVFFAVLSFSSIAQVISNVELIEFSEVFVNSPDSTSFYIINKTQNDVSVKISNLKEVYSLSDTMITVLSSDSTLVWLKYSPNQNVIDYDLVFITSDDSLVGSVIELNGSGKYGDSYDAATFNLYDSQLKTALTQLVSGHTSLGYNSARDKMFMEFDNQRVNGQGADQNTIECVYTGRLAVGYINRTDAFNNFSINTEHTWPQSNFGEAEPMKSDLYHLFPTDITANSMRANYPFGKAVSNITWQVGGSKLGNNSSGQLIFEPRDMHKGDVSRSMFYFITRYPINYGNFFTQTQEIVFKEWNKFDTVGVIESNRNNAIALLQFKRNPYIDHPEFVDRIYSFATNNVRPTFAELNVLPLKIEFDSTLIGTSSSTQIYIANSGSAQLNIDSITISDPRFTSNSNPGSIESYSFSKIQVEFNPDSIKNYDATLTVYSDGGIKNILLTGIGKDNTVNVEDEIYSPAVFTLEQNYPNPFNPSTKIRYTIPTITSGSSSRAETRDEGSRVQLKVYDVLGNEVATLVNEYKPAGNYVVEFNAAQSAAADFPAIASGIYFYRLQAGNFVSTKKMILLK